MKAVVCLMPKPKGLLPFLRLIVSPAVTSQKIATGAEEMMLYLCNPLQKCRFPNILARIRKNHSLLLLEDAWKAYPSLYQEPSVREVFLRHFERILSCFCGGSFLRPVIFSKTATKEMAPLLRAFARHASVVTLCTEDAAWFEATSQEALSEWGLSLNLRNPDSIGEPDLAVLLSPLPAGIPLSCPVINLSDSKNPPDVSCLMDFTDHCSETFFQNHPHLHLRHCHLVQENSRIQNLIWKIQKKS